MGERKIEEKTRALASEVNTMPDFSTGARASRPLFREAGETPALPKIGNLLSYNALVLR